MQPLTRVGQGWPLFRRITWFSIYQLPSSAAPYAARAGHAHGLVPAAVALVVYCDLPLASALVAAEECRVFVDAIPMEACRSPPALTAAEHAGWEFDRPLQATELLLCDALAPRVDSRRDERLLCRELAEQDTMLGDAERRPQRDAVPPRCGQRILILGALRDVRDCAQPPSSLVPESLDDQVAHPQVVAPADRVAQQDAHLRARRERCRRRALAQDAEQQLGRERRQVENGLRLVLRATCTAARSSRRRRVQPRAPPRGRRARLGARRATCGPPHNFSPRAANLGVLPYL